MISAKTLVMFEDAEQHTEQDGGRGISEKGGGEMEGKYSIGSMSPSSAEESLLRAARSGAEAMESALRGGLESPLQDESLNSTAHHTSPLESISELDENDEHANGGSELKRGPADGALKVKGQTTETQPPLSPGRKRIEVAEISGHTGTQSGASLVQTLMSEGTYDDLLQLNGSKADHSECPRSASANRFFKTEFDKMQVEETWVGENSCSPSESGIDKEKERQKLVKICPVDCDGNIKGAKQDTRLPVTLLKELRDVQMQQESHQAEIKHLSSKLTDSTERIRELEYELNSERKRNESHAYKIQELEKMSNDSLIEVLTECKSKVEQFEELKHSSVDLKIQLQAAQGTVAFLQRRMVSLEEERSQRQHEVLQLSRELEGARKALREKSAEAAWVSKQLQALRREVEGKWGAGATVEEKPANGHVDTSHPPQSRQDSRVCVLL
nr:uncharacterized protein LOC111837514 [Paramormyrops kingsleyae]